MAVIPVGLKQEASSAQRLYRRRRGGRLVGRLLLYALALISSLLFVFPFVWTLTSSLKDFNEVYRFPPTLLPEQVLWDNYPKALAMHPVARWMWNSTVVTALSVIGVVTSSSLAAYAFSRFRYPGRDFLFTLTLSTMMLPDAVLLIPRYLLFHRLGWLDTFLPLVVPSYFGGGAFNIFLLRQFFLTIPNDLPEAATIDGADSLRILTSIMLPLSKPALATVSIIHILWSWNNFIEPLIYLNTPEKFTMAIGIKYFERSGPGGSGAAAYGTPIEHLLMACAVMMTAPIVVLFFAFQRYFVQGVVMSGIKG